MADKAPILHSILHGDLSATPVGVGQTRMPISSPEVLSASRPEVLEQKPAAFFPRNKSVKELLGERAETPVKLRTVTKTVSELLREKKARESGVQSAPSTNPRNILRQILQEKDKIHFDSRTRQEQRKMIFGTNTAEPGNASTPGPLLRNRRSASCDDKLEGSTAMNPSNAVRDPCGVSSAGSGSPLVENVVLPRDREGIVVKHLQQLGDHGYRYTRLQFARVATQMAEYYKLIMADGKLLSDQWVTAFCRRWPEAETLLNSSTKQTLPAPEGAPININWNLIDLAATQDALLTHPVTSVQPIEAQKTASNLLTSMVLSALKNAD